MNPFPPAFAAAALMLAAPDGPPARTARDIVVGNTDASGQAQGALARAGWREVRGFRWKILTQDPTGRFVPTPMDKTFETGTAFRIEFQAYNDMWVYLLNQGPKGNQSVVLPAGAQEHLLVKKDQTITIPDDPKRAFFFSNPPGDELFVVVTSPSRLETINPTELIRKERKVPLSAGDEAKAEAQRDDRDRLLDDLRQKKAAKEVTHQPPAEVLVEKGSKGFGTRDTILVPPHDDRDGPGRTTIQASTNPNPEPIIDEVRLKHQPRE